MFQQSAEIESVLGPPLRRSIIQLTGSPLLHRTMWVCGCSVEYADNDDAHRDAFNPTMRWHQCVYHHKVVQLSMA
jgi:hypothetical protein